MAAKKAHMPDVPGEMNCWEFQKCGHDRLDNRDEDKCMVAKLSDLGAGKVCWVVKATRCGGKLQGGALSKFDKCRKCDFYKLRNNGKATS